MTKSQTFTASLCPAEPFKNQKYPDRLLPSEAEKHKNFLLIASTWAETSFYPEDLTNAFCKTYVISFGDRPIGSSGLTANHAIIGGVQGKWRRTGEGHMNFARLYLLHTLQEMYPKRLRVQPISEREFVKFHNDPDSDWDATMRMNTRAKRTLEEIRNYVLNHANKIVWQRKDRVRDIFDLMREKEHKPKEISEELAFDMKPFLLYGWDKYDGPSTHENFLKVAAAWAASVRSTDENEKDQPCANFALILGKDEGEPTESIEDLFVLGVSQDFVQTGKGQMNFARAYIIMMVQARHPGLLSIRPFSRKEFEKIQGNNEWNSKANMHVACIQRLHLFKMLVLADCNLRKLLKQKVTQRNVGGGRNGEASVETGANEKMVIDMLPFLLDGWDKVEESCTI